MCLLQYLDHVKICTPILIVVNLDTVSIGARASGHPFVVTTALADERHVVHSLETDSVPRTCAFELDMPIATAIHAHERAPVAMGHVVKGQRVQARAEYLETVECESPAICRNAVVLLLASADASSHAAICCKHLVHRSSLASERVPRVGRVDLQRLATRGRVEATLKLALCLSPLCLPLLPLAHLLQPLFLPSLVLLGWPPRLLMLPVSGSLFLSLSLRLFPLLLLALLFPRLLALLCALPSLGGRVPRFSLEGISKRLVWVA
mmetsp:Transcript_45191/g.124090  ORF Transcript_45191/g.124090 Transcript_45191/m.124090 type:complete len:264 (-) Transcript_45191:311-1102(-)